MKKFLPLIAFIALTACTQPADPNGGVSSVSSESSSTSGSLSAGVNNTDLPLRVPAGFVLDTFATDLSGARVIEKDGFVNLWISRTSAGIVSHIDLRSGSAAIVGHPLRNLNRPHGLAIDGPTGTTLYVAEENMIRRVHLYSDGPIEDVSTLPAGGRHYTRTLGIGPDGRLYVSIGSTCDVCVEANELHGTIMSMKTDGSDQCIEAKGLRNSVFFDWHPTTGDLWATEMGRDMVGDDVPPEEVNIISSGSHYGWPFCYGDRVRDQEFQFGTEFDCASTVTPHLMFQAHSAPLGMAFIPEEGWPEEYHHDLLVAQHGSWNRSTPVGYKIVRFPLDENGNSQGAPVDFITGWYQNGIALGRPVDLLAEPDGVLYITDDKTGEIYRLSKSAE